MNTFEQINDDTYIVQFRKNIEDINNMLAKVTLLKFSFSSLSKLASTSTRNRTMPFRTKYQCPSLKSAFSLLNFCPQISLEYSKCSECWLNFQDMRLSSSKGEEFLSSATYSSNSTSPIQLSSQLSRTLLLRFVLP